MVRIISNQKWDDLADALDDFLCDELDIMIDGEKTAEMMRLTGPANEYPPICRYISEITIRNCTVIFRALCSSFAVVSHMFGAFF